MRVTGIRILDGKWGADWNGIQLHRPGRLTQRSHPAPFSGHSLPIIAWLKEDLTNQDELA